MTAVLYRLNGGVCECDTRMPLDVLDLPCFGLARSYFCRSPFSLTVVSRGQCIAYEPQPACAWEAQLLCMPYAYVDKGMARRFRSSPDRELSTTTTLRSTTGITAPVLYPRSRGSGTRWLSCADVICVSTCPRCLACSQTQEEASCDRL